ncbi:MAG: ATP synthase F0 subunit B [Clostridia bacterium]|nr:ATP synthase F0 subunit B [Clostridia bacterium]
MSLPLNIDLQQILLHMLNLVLLFGGLYLILYKPVKKFMDDRAKKYEEADAAAGEKLAKAEALLKEAGDKLANAEAEIAEKAERSRIAAEEKAESIIEDAKKAKKKMLDDAEDAAQREKNTMINDARKEIAELAVEAAKKVLSEKAGEKTDA